jgi:predicted DNA-binding transcriptional regulator AlpA
MTRDRRVPRALESTSTPAEQPQGDRDVARQRAEIPLHAKTYLTPIETAEYLGLPSLNALKKRMQRGTIPTWTWSRLGGSSLRFVRASLDEWLQPTDHAAALKLVHGGQSAALARARKRKGQSETAREGGDR